MNPDFRRAWARFRTFVIAAFTERLAYNLKGSYSRFEQGYKGGGELFECPTLNGVAHTSQLVDPQPPGRQTPPPAASSATSSAASWYSSERCGGG